MTAVAVKYDDFWTHLAAGRAYWTSDTIKVAMLGASYSPDVANDSVFADVSAAEVSGTGYTGGGETLGSKTATPTALDAADVEWSNLTAAPAYAVFYRSGAINGATDPLLGYIDLDSTADELTVVASKFILQFNAIGIFSLT